MPKARRMSPSFKGYSKSVRKGYYVDPDGFVFRFGRKQSDGNISLFYLSNDKSSKQCYMEWDMYTQLQNVINRDSVEDQKINTNHELFKPGGIGFLFLKQQTLVGKKENKN
jgi:hypothetical protein